MKQLPKKCKAARHDPYLAMLIYRATPLSRRLPAPSELINGRRYRALLPTRSLAQNAHRQIVREQMVADKERSTKHYKSARNVPPLPMQQKVYVPVSSKQNQWTPATITQTSTATQPRSYTVETKDGAHYQGNRKFIQPAEETPHLMKQQMVTFPAAALWSGPDGKIRDLTDL